MKSLILFGLSPLIKIQLFLFFKQKFFKKVLTFRIEFGIIENVKSGAQLIGLS